ncbi:MAG: Uma2 family endonuclease [Methylococcaceae bacterium]|nr:Uma2 family endonuclease [Methylococcaceae bacterium]
MSNLAFKEVSYDDILDLPENIVGEILNGQLETHPRPAPKHALAATSMAGELVLPFQKGRGGSGGWWILVEPECHVDTEVFVPDLAGWRKLKMPKLPETAWFEITPDWVCEIISPSSVRRDRVTKMEIYARLGISYFWIIDPIAQTLEAYQLQNKHWVLLKSYADAEEIAIAPFAEYSFSLANLWE